MIVIEVLPLARIHLRRKTFLVLEMSSEFIFGITRLSSSATSSGISIFADYHLVLLHLELVYLRIIL